MKRFLQRACATAGTLALLAAPFASHAAVTASFGSGDLIKGSGDTVYYFAPNGKRYVFPNSKTYFTWYKDFSGVKTISDGQLSTIPLGGNVTYRPGYKMVKITTDPRVYVVDQGGVLRHVGSESLAQTLYGLSWKNQIDDIPDAFFINYRVGTDIQTASDYQPANVMTLTANISQDKQFDNTNITVSIGTVANGFVPTTDTVKVGTTVTWVNRDTMVHNVTGTGFSSGDIQPGASWSHTFGSTGSYDYHCTIHPTMQGTINVVN
ncbi:MAG TPA: plastocyanin/azurin family copper-binding protein [Verrucomicrobiae bacterium]|nr:plastocyanin/azurin family copper-binding protein [Verrucomicrobiae bacterium]